MAEEQPGIRALSLFDEDYVSVLGGSLDWLPLRRRLGIQAFGINAFRAKAAGDNVIEDHVESPGQQELYVVITGRMRMSVGDEEREAAAGDVLFVEDPDLRRGAIALEDDTLVLAVGGWADQAYHSLPWEPIFLAQDAMGRGDWAEAAEILERESGEHREKWIVRFRLACCRAQMGELDTAADELAKAIEANPDARERALEEDALAPIRDRI